MKSCKWCNTGFEVSKEDREFLTKVSPNLSGKVYPISDPTLCPDCRMQRRMAARAERKLYSNTCSLCQKKIVSLYSPDKPFKPLCFDCYWGDGWDPKEYGRDFDFSRPFFDQLRELWEDVPVIGLWLIQQENSDYNSNAFQLKDCYMCFCSDFCEGVLYGYCAEYCNFCVDVSHTLKSELCYEAVDCVNCYECFFSFDLENSNNCYFSSDLVGCKNVWGSHGLSHKEYYIYNKQVSKEEWEAFMNTVKFTSETIKNYKEASLEVKKTLPRRASRNINVENVAGNHLYDCKNATNAFDSHDCENIKNVIYAPVKAENTQDGYALGGTKWTYEFIGGGLNVERTAFILNTANGLVDSYYNFLCTNTCEYVFGSAGLRKSKYCILNKQYTKEEYEELVPKIIEHMKKTGEWGEFFDPRISPYGYNETVAQEYYPLTKEEALAKGFTWCDFEAPKPDAPVIPATRIPDYIDDVPDDILHYAIECERSQKLFKITSQELRFYRDKKLPIPRLHPDERHKDRIKDRRPRKLFTRTCDKCQNTIQAVFPQDYPEEVYCEPCYVNEVY